MLFGSNALAQLMRNRVQQQGQQQQPRVGGLFGGLIARAMAAQQAQDAPATQGGPAMMGGYRRPMMPPPGQMPGAAGPTPGAAGPWRGFTRRPMIGAPPTANPAGMPMQPPVMGNAMNLGPGRFRR